MFSTVQVREAIGVALSVLCSNMRLHALSPDNPNDLNKSPAEKGFLEERWAKLLTDRALEVAMNVHNASQSDNLDGVMDTSPQNGPSSSDSQDNVKWMETVLVLCNNSYSKDYLFNINLTDHFDFSATCRYSILSSHL